MRKRFTTTGACDSNIHYMANLDNRLEKVKELIDNGEYFTINQPKLYGKTTMIHVLKKYLSPEYIVINIDFQMLNQENFKNENAFVSVIANELLIFTKENKIMPKNIEEQLKQFSENNSRIGLRNLFICLSKWCQISEKAIVLMADHIDSASNHQVFLDFLAQLRGYYLHRDDRATFQSVIFAGIHDIKNLKQNFQKDDILRRYSPWNIAVDFDVDMNFTISDIESMLIEYKKDCQVEMDINQIANLLYEYTSGYPFLVSLICELIDKKTDKWDKNSVLEAIDLLLSKENVLFDFLYDILSKHEEIKKMLYAILFKKDIILYNSDDEVVGTAITFGFVKNQEGVIMIKNRIFEVFLCHCFEMQDKPLPDRSD